MLYARRGGAEAEGHLRKAVELEPRDAWAHIYLGTYLSRGDVDSAMAEFHIARELKPDWTVPLWSLGNLHGSEGKDYDLAASFFERALQLDPDDVVTLTDFGRLCKRRGQIDLAKHYLGKALLLDPMYGKARALLNDIAGDGSV